MGCTGGQPVARCGSLYLDLSKIEAGRMELELADFDLPAAVDSALTLVRERAELHGGRIWVTSQVGVGSTFTFTIPVHRNESPQRSVRLLSARSVDTLRSPP